MNDLIPQGFKSTDKLQILLERGRQAVRDWEELSFKKYCTFILLRCKQLSLIKSFFQIGSGKAEEVVKSR